jgi:serine protease Do
MYCCVKGRRRVLDLTKTILAAFALVSFAISAAVPAGAAGAGASSSRTATQPVVASFKSDKSKVVQRALRQSVRVEVLVRGKVARAASGVVVATEGTTSYVLTNEHVVERAGLSSTASFEVVVERPRLHRLAARVIFEGHVPEEDLALLAVEGEKLDAVTIAGEDQVDVGDDVVVVGAPYGRSLSVSSGIVSQLELDEQDAHVQRSMKTDAPIGYGASGGGVFELPSGRLCGLVEGYRTAKVAFGGISKDDFSFDVPMPGETFLSPPGKIHGFLTRAGIGKLAGLSESRTFALSPQSAAAPVARAR